MAEIGDGDVGNVVRKEAAGGRAALAVWCLGCRVFTVFLLLAVNRVCAAPPGLRYTHVGYTVSYTRTRYSSVPYIQNGTLPVLYSRHVTHLPRAPSFRRPPSSRRGEALWDRVEAGSGSPGAASSESAAGSGRLSGLAAVLAAVESVAVFVRVCVVGFGWMVVRFVRVIRLPACARLSRGPVCPVHMCVPAPFRDTSGTHPPSLGEVSSGP